MINGNTHREGMRPPFRPAAVIDAIRQVLLRPRLPGSQITGLVGPPDFITGCAVTGDLAALAAGQYAELGLHARATVTDAAQVRDRVTKAAVPGHRPPRFTHDPGRPVIVLDKFPPYVNTDDVIRSIADRAQGHAWHARHPELGALTGLPIGDVADLTTRGDYWFACLPSDDTPPDRPAGSPPGSLRQRSTTFPPPSATGPLDGIACAVVGAQLPVSRADVEGVTALDSARGCGADRLGRPNHQFDVGCHAQRQLHPGVRAG
jgi:hypothetical protein